MNPLPTFLGDKLRPHQPKAVEHLIQVLQKYRSGVDWSDTGTGKSYVAAAVAAALKLSTLVVGPKISRSTWDRAAARFNDTISFSNYELLRTGNTDFGKWDNYKPGRDYLQCEHCQCVVEPDRPVPCFAHARGIHSVIVKRKSPRYGDFRFHPAIRLIVFDESHRCNGLDSLNADLSIAAKRQNIPSLYLSATAACSPIQMRALGFALDIHSDKRDLLTAGYLPRVRVPSFDRWLRSKGYERDERFHGWKWFCGAERQQEIMKQIREQIIPERGVRIRTADIPGFPSVDIQAELYTLDNPESVDGCYAEMAAALEQLHSTTLGDKNPDHPLTKILRARQKVELLKVPVMTELAEDYRAKGFSVVFFVNFRATIDELFKRFPGAGIIDGQTEGREDTISGFQSNQLRELLCNSDAGGISMSLQDLEGNYPRVGLVSPGFSATTLRQVFGRLPRDGGKSVSYYRVIFADKTVEVPVWRAVRGKLNCLDSLLDAHLQPSNLAFRR